jgi:uncharacterized peroxidase-related enzyme
MNDFTIYNSATARPPADDLLEGVENMLGFVPNIFAVAAESAPALYAFIELNYQFAESGFDATARELILTATSVENECTYCVAGETAFAEMEDVPGEIIQAVRNNRTVPDIRLEILNQFTRQVVKKRGMISEHDLQLFFEAGFTRAQMLEVILGICVKTFSNLANNIIGIPLDEQFRKHAWKPRKRDYAA